VFDDIVINMIDVGEETGELDRCSSRSPTTTTRKSTPP
jgi:type II secretory pathway component PulF